MDKALPYYLEAVKYSEDDGDLEAISTISVNIGEIYFNQDKLTDALFYFEKSRAALEEGKHYYALPYTLSSIGKVYARQGDFSNAIEFQTSAVKMASANNFEFEKAFALTKLGDSYREAKLYQKALKAFFEAKDVAEKTGSKESNHILEGLVATYSSLGDFKNAFRYHAMLSELKDNLYTEDNAKTIQRFQLEFETQRPGRRRRRRPQEVRVRHLGKHSEHRQPSGVQRRGWPSEYFSSNLQSC